MKNDEIVNAILNGELLAVVEWRGSVARAFTNTDPQTNRKSESLSIVHRVELKDLQLEIVEKIKPEEHPGFSVKDYNEKPKPFKKGEKVLWHLASFGWRGEGRGMKRTASGSLSKIN